MRRTCSNHVVQPGSLFRRNALRPFNEQAYYFFDFEWVLGLPPSRVRRIPETLASYRVHPASKSVGEPRRKAQDYVRIADVLGDEGRASAYAAAGEYFYDALCMREARRYLLRGLRLDP